MELRYGGDQWFNFLQARARAEAKVSHRRGVMRGGSIPPLHTTLLGLLPTLRPTYGEKTMTHEKSVCYFVNQNGLPDIQGSHPLFTPAQLAARLLLAIASTGNWCSANGVESLRSLSNLSLNFGTRSVVARKCTATSLPS